MPRTKRTRTANGEGTTYFEKSRQRWVVQVTTARGERKSFYGKKQGDALERRDNFLRNQDKGLDMSVRYKLSTFLEEYLELTRNSIEYKTYTNYVSTVNNYIIPKIGKIELR